MSNADGNRMMAIATARANAIRRLQQLHEEDWESIYGEERVAQGLSYHVPTDAEKRLQRENKELRAKLRESGLA